MKLGANSVLFGGFNLQAAFEHIAMAGYDGIEISALDGMSQHLVLERWRQIAPEIKQLSRDFGLELLAMQQTSHDPRRMEQAFQAAVEIGIPIINCDPGGVAEDEASFQQLVDSIGKLVLLAEHYGVVLCIKAHVGSSIYNTPTTQRLMEAITSPSFGVNLDPSHIYRAGEDPVEALKAVIGRVRNVHIRDCKGRQHGPGRPEDQTNGRGDIDLVGFIRTLYEARYQGPVDLEIIGAKDYSLVQCAVIAAEARGHMQACLQACGAYKSNGA
jgi:sugar phosphate isomerase/epimerase